ncbi:MAG: antirestriction protein ArdC [Neolewinella sp.]|jgi:antirestriction protein ArdC
MSMKYCAAKRKTRVKPDLYQVITEKVIALLEAGTIPWQRPWNQYGLARNYATGHVYTGHESRLNRPGITLPMEQRVPRSEPHAHEELIAELGAIYLCQHAGICPPFGFRQNLTVCILSV